MNIFNLQRQYAFFFFIVLVLFFFSFSATVCAQSIIPKNLVIDNRDGNVTLHLDLNIQNKRQIEQALKEGKNLRLILTSSLYKKRFFLWDSCVSTQKTVWKMTSNPVSRQVTIRQNSISTVLARKDFWSALNSQMEKLKIVFVDWEKLDPHPEQYFVVLEIQLGRELPVWVKIVDTFWQDGLEQNIRYEMALDN